MTNESGFTCARRPPAASAAFADEAERAVERRITLVCIAYTAISVLPLFMTSALSVEISRDVGLDRTQLGLAFAAPFALGALVAPVVGPRLDRIGPTAGVRIAAGIVCVSLLMLAGLSRTWWAVVVILGLSGIGTVAGQLSVNLALSGGVSEGHQGLAFGAKEAAVPMASLGASLLLPFIALPLGWRAAFVVASLLAATAAIAHFPLSSGHAPQEHTVTPWRPTQLIMALAVVGFFAGAIGNSLSTFVVDSAVSQGFDQSTAAGVLAVSSIATVSARVGIGLFVDARASSGIVELGVMSAIAACALLVLSLFGGSAIPFVVGTVVFFAAGWGWPGLLFYAVVRADPMAAASATGFALSAVFVGTMVGPIMIGAIAENVGYPAAWLAGACTFAAATAAAAAALRVHRSVAR